MRVAWRTVGGIITRVVREAEAAVDRLSGLRRIGIDEISHRKGHKYLIVVVDHDQGRLVWATPGRDEAAMSMFFEALGPKRCALLKLVSADAAPWIASVVRRYCPNARLCLDPFHVVAWATDALDQVRRQVWNAARRTGRHGVARELKGARFALWKNPENLTRRQETKLASIRHLNEPLFRAYLLKEQLGDILDRRQPNVVRALLLGWISWALRSRLPAFVRTAQTIREYLDEIVAYVRWRVTNGLVEGLNTKARLLTRRAYGFHSAAAVLAMIMLCCSGIVIPPPRKRLAG
jgi:transposase